jgi:hypothetical protein
MCGDKLETLPALGNSSRRKNWSANHLKKIWRYCKTQKRWQQKHNETFIEYLRYKRVHIFLSSKSSVEAPKVVDTLRIQDVDSVEITQPIRGRPNDRLDHVRAIPM